MRRVRWLGPYRLLYRVASGGMAEVYRAQHDELDVAIKRLLPRYNEDEEFIVMLTDEARITGWFDHPNIVRLFEFCVVDDQHFLAMEFVDGVDLRSFVRRCRTRENPPTPVMVAYIVEQALRGLHAAHQQTDHTGRSMDVVHRDISPSNILLSFHGAIKLIDFGIAKAHLNRARTRGGVIKGKVKYMSPEQTEGRRLDARSDVFSAGIVLFYGLTGHTPFNAPSDAELMLAIREQHPDPPSAHVAELGESIDAILRTALAKRPQDRFDTAADFAEALAAWRRARDPHFHPGRLAAHLQSAFAAERQEAMATLGELDLNAPEEHGSQSSMNTNYTQLVDAGWRTGARGPEPLEDLDAWLAAHRIEAEGTGTRETEPGAPPTDA
jgi:eukaryotic-like serine/threonine-protein kinase